MTFQNSAMCAMFTICCHWTKILWWNLSLPQVSERKTWVTEPRCWFVHRSICERNSEAELFSLRDSNAKLVAALREANSSIEHWKTQLAEYQEETDRLREQVRNVRGIVHPKMKVYRLFTLPKAILDVYDFLSRSKIKVSEKIIAGVFSIKKSSAQCRPFWQSKIHI